MAQKLPFQKSPSKAAAPKPAAAAPKMPNGSIPARMKAGRGMSHGTKPGKMKGC